jgi:hypothetical protein
MHQESAPADAGTLRLDQSEDGLCRNSRIDRAAAGAQNFAPCGRGEWVGGRDHVLAWQLVRARTAGNQPCESENGPETAISEWFFPFIFQ